MDDAVGDKSLLIDYWYLDKIRTCMALRSTVAQNIWNETSKLFPPSYYGELHVGTSSFSINAVKNRSQTTGFSLFSSPGY